MVTTPSAQRPSPRAPRATFTAVLRSSYGPPDELELGQVEKPAVGDDEVLVRVAAGAVNPYDWHLVRGLPYVVRLSEGLRRPREQRIGVDIAGTVEAVGKDVTQLRPGDEVFGERMGAFAEYVCGGEQRFTRKPANLTFEQAAAVPMAGLTALQGLRDHGRLQPRQHVLVNGASGGVGTFAVQIAKVLGAEVTAVCSTRNVELVRSLGADHVVDHTRDDFTRTGDRFDLVLDIAASRSLQACRRVLAAQGTLVIIGATDGRWLAPLARPAAALVRSRLGQQRMLAFLAKHSNDDLAVLRTMIEAGQITPVIDRTYTLAEVPEAVRYVEQGHARGKVVITVRGA